MTGIGFRLATASSTTAITTDCRSLGNTQQLVSDEARFSMLPILLSVDADGKGILRFESRGQGFPIWLRARSIAAAAAERALCRASPSVANVVPLSTADGTACPLSAAVAVHLPSVLCWVVISTGSPR